MKNSLKILLVISAIITLPFPLKAQHEGHEEQPKSSGYSGYHVSEDLGDGLRIQRPVTQEDIDQARARREEAQAQKKSQENSKAQGYDGYFYQKNTTNRGEAYTGGTLNLSADSVTKQKQNMINDGLSQMGAMSQSASSLTKDPRTAGVVMATGSGLGALTSLVNAAGYGTLAGQYAGVQAQNAQKAAENTAKMAALKTKLKTLDPKSSDYQSLEADIQEIRMQRNLQNNAAKQAGNNKLGNYMGMGASILTGLALGYMGERQYDMARQMANDQKACKRDPTQCQGYIPPRPAGDNRPLPVPPDTRPTGPEGFDPNRLPKPTQASVTSKDGANSSNRGSSGNRSGHAPEFLSSSGLLGKGTSPFGEKSESDFGGGYSEDQSFGSAGGGSGSGRESAGSYGSVGGSSGEDANFDISQFIPGWMKDQQVPTDENGFLIAKQIASAKNETKGLLLGKNSPSLFTRVSQAYQKKAHELKEEVL